MINKPWLVNIIESERGWGQRLEEVKGFDKYEDAVAFVKRYNADNNKTVVPDWYMRAEAPRRNVEFDAEKARLYPDPTSPCLW